MPSAPPPAEARSADALIHAASFAAPSIVTYRFGTSQEATRPDRVMRPSTAAILMVRRGGLFEHAGAGKAIPMPRLALLGPSDQGRIWSTAPGTEFTLVNLAPGASRNLLGVDPREIADETEPLNGNALVASLQEQLAGGPHALHTYLCNLMQAKSQLGHEHALRKHLVINALKMRRHGDQVKDYADHFGVTPRTLQRMVHESLGLTPKQVLGIERIRDLVSLTSGGWRRTRADLALCAGYFDQSHMRHELLRHNFGQVGELLDGDHIVNDS